MLNSKNQVLEQELEAVLGGNDPWGYVIAGLGGAAITASIAQCYYKPKISALKSTDFDTYLSLKRANLSLKELQDTFESLRKKVEDRHPDWVSLTSDSAKDFTNIVDPINTKSSRYKTETTVLSASYK